VNWLKKVFKKNIQETEQDEEWGSRKSELIFDRFINNRDRLKKAELYKNMKDEGYAPPGMPPNIEGRITLLEKREEKLLEEYREQRDKEEGG